MIINRFSYSSCVVADLKNNPETKGLNYYKNAWDKTHWVNKALDKLDFSKLPEDYDGDNYDLNFDEQHNYIGAS